MELSGWKDKFGDMMQVRVTPKASSNSVKIEERDAGPPLVRVYVTTVPEDGKANDAVIKLLAKKMGVPKSALTIIKGLSSRDKTIRIR